MIVQYTILNLETNSEELSGWVWRGCLSYNYCDSVLFILEDLYVV